MLARRDVLNPCWGSRDRIADILATDGMWSDRRVFRSRSGFGVCKIKFENWVSLGVYVSVGYIGSRTTS